MTNEDTVAQVRQELVNIQHECFAQGDNPRFIRVVECLIRLCGDESASTGDNATNPAPISLVENHSATLEDEKSCKDTGLHQNINVYGICKNCGTCTHIAVDPATGQCRNCEAAVSEPEMPA